jgi:uncharacterized membrane protein
MNTVFKFYFQTWVLWSIAGAYGLANLGRRCLHHQVAATARWSGAGRSVQCLGLLASAILVLGGAIYTPLAVGARAREYGGQPTLDGAAHLAARDAGDFAAIRWLNANVAGAPVVLEAHGGSYQYAARISAHTGLPTVLGWPGHERQWRGGTRQQAGRAEDIDVIYAAEDADTIIALLDRHEVRYVVIGNFERARYEAEGLERLAALLTLVLDAGTTAVYER